MEIHERRVIVAFLTPLLTNDNIFYVDTAINPIITITPAVGWTAIHMDESMATIIVQTLGGISPTYISESDIQL